MERDCERNSDLIDLGAVSAETKGLEGKVHDFALGITGTSLTDD